MTTVTATLSKSASPRLRITALAASTVFSSCAGLFAKLAETSFSPLVMTLLRVWLAGLVLTPIALSQVPGGLRWRRFVRCLPVSLGYSGNIVLFAIGINATTAMASQLLYLLVPVVVLIAARFLFAESLALTKIVGTVLGISGAVLVLVGSLRGNLGDSLGTPLGNGVILLAVFAWAAFLLASRSLSESYHPLELSSYALLTSAIIVPCLALPEVLGHHALQGPLTWVGILGAVGMALVVSVARDITFQWGIKGTSAFIASALGFAGPFLTVAYAIPLLGEQLTLSLLLSGVLTLLSLLFAVILPSWQAQRQAQAGAAPAPTQITLPTDELPSLSLTGDEQ